MSYIVEPVIGGAIVAEGPHWNAETKTLYYIDILGFTINKYKPSTKEHAKASIGVTTSFIIPVEGTTNKFVVSMKRDLAIVTWDGVSDVVSSIEKICEVDNAEGFSDTRINDGKADPTGTLWMGTMFNSMSVDPSFPKAGSFYSLNKDRHLKHHFSGVQISNGLAWSTDVKMLYYIDSLKGTVDQFDFDITNEAISNRTTVFTLAKHNIEGFPDGLTIDTDGNLWVAIYNGSKVIKVDPRIPESLLQTIDIPALKVTSVTFGGSNLDELYVTTAQAISEDRFTESAGGRIYKVKGLGVKGYAGTRVKL